MTVQFEPVSDPGFWDRCLSVMPNAHVLQCWAWGDFKTKYHWRPARYAWNDDAGQTLALAQVLQRRLIVRGLRALTSVMYCPRGPVFDWSRMDLWSLVLSRLRSLALASGAVFLKIDPEVPVDEVAGSEAMPEPATANAVAETLAKAGWRRSKEEIQFRNTLVLDLRRSEVELLEAMKQKTRYNIRLAERHGVSVRLGGTGDFDLLYRMYAVTSQRDGFVIRPPEYYKDAWADFIALGLAQPLVAEVSGTPVAALIVYRFGPRAWYFYGMSTERHREKMPNHLLQWAAVRWAKSQGCTTYDFWGAPEQLDPKDAMWGVYRFKLGFGATLVRTLGAWDYVVRPAMYWIYHVAMPRILGLMRARRMASTRRLID